MITPTIRPRIAFKPISRGLIVAARNSVNKVQESTQTISKKLDKNEKFAMNYVEFFGSKKTTKILKKNLKSIRDSLMATFSMAKILKKKVSGLSKAGGIGGALGAIGGLFAKAGIGKLLLIGLIGLAVGGVTFLLYKNAGKFFRFLRDKIELLTPIVERIIKAYIERTTLPSGMVELTDELSSNVDSGVENLMEENPNLTKDEAISKSVKTQLNILQKEIDDLYAKRAGLKFFADFQERNEIAAMIERLKAAQKFLRTGNRYADPVSSFFFSRFTQGVQIPEKYNDMTMSSRLNSVKNFVDNSPKSLDTLEYELLRSVNLPGGEAKIRFYEDALNYINAKRNNDKFDEKRLLPESFDQNLIKSGNIDEFKTRFPDIFNYTPSKTNKQSNVIIQNGSSTSQKQNNNNQQVVSSGADSGGVIDIKFLSALDYDSLSLPNSKNLYNIYMN